MNFQTKKIEKLEETNRQLKFDLITSDKDTDRLLEEILKLKKKLQRVKMFVGNFIAKDDGKECANEVNDMCDHLEKII